MLVIEKIEAPEEKLQRNSRACACQAKRPYDFMNKSLLISDNVKKTQGHDGCHIEAAVKESP